MSIITNGIIYSGVGTETAYNKAEFPFVNYYEDTRMQVLVSKAELNASGFTTSGTITAMSVKLANAEADTTGFGRIVIGVKHTLSTTLTKFEASTTFTKCFDAKVLRTSFTNNTWKELTFTTTFEWDGINNIIIDIIRDDATFSGTMPSQYGYYETALTNTSRSYYSDSVLAYPFDSAGGTNSRYKPSLLLSMNVITDINITSVKASSSANAKAPSIATQIGANIAPQKFSANAVSKTPSVAAVRHTSFTSVKSSSNAAMRNAIIDMNNKTVLPVKGTVSAAMRNAYVLAVKNAGVSVSKNAVSALMTSPAVFIEKRGTDAITYRYLQKFTYRQIEEKTFRYLESMPFFAVKAVTVNLDMVRRYRMNTQFIKNYNASLKLINKYKTKITVIRNSTVNMEVQSV